MKPYLVFRLYGPMASWGVPAVGGDRHTALAPTRSAILGLLGAALGIRRQDEQALNALHSSVDCAVKQTVPSSLLRDYHTAQVPSTHRKTVHRTRKSELAEPKLNTILSSRDYRCDGLWVVAISLRNQATVTLEGLQAALCKPVFSLYLGRKSCPPAAPLMPRVLQRCALKTALDTDFPSFLRSAKQDNWALGANDWATYFWEGERDALGDVSVITTHPWDDPLSRSRWQFQPRAMHQATLQTPASQSESPS